MELTVPVLTAPTGLTLRPWRLADPDLALVREASADPYIPLITTVPPSYSEAEGRAFVERQWSRAATGAGYPFAIELPAVDAGQAARPVGFIGLWLKDLAQGRASLGYWLSPAARGHAIAGTALATVAEWAFRDLEVPRLELCVEPWNTASARTAERAGFRREGVLRGWQQVGEERRDMVMYGRLRGDAGRPAEVEARA
ncbi:GNAT family N-acetyltransferase [Streptomyces sp. NPDC003943]